MKQPYFQHNLFLGILLLFLIHILNLPHVIANDIQFKPPENSGQVSVKFSPEFDPDSFEYFNVELNPKNGFVGLKTKIKTGIITIPFTQVVAISFIFEGSHYNHAEFGWMTPTHGPDGDRNIIYKALTDDFPQNGVLDHLEVDKNHDGILNGRDNKLFLGPFLQGTELIFYLDTSKNACNESCGGLFFTQRDWNEPHTKCDPGIRRTFRLYEPAGPRQTDCMNYEKGCETEINVNGWLEKITLSWLKDSFGLNLSQFNPDDPGIPNTYCIDELNQDHATHALISGLDQSPFATILGFEDSLMNLPKKLNDFDFNDIVFLVEQKNGGMIKLKPEKALIPDMNMENAFFTGAEIQVFDYLAACNDYEKGDIEYFLSIDSGNHWIKIDTWDQVEEINPANGNIETDEHGLDISELIKENVGFRRKTRRVNFTDMGLAGKRLTWKAELVSKDGKCIPVISQVILTGYYGSHGYLTQSSPLIKANLIYTSCFETPKEDWNHQTYRGHLCASRIYDPISPNQTITQDRIVWDAGNVLKNMSPDDRKIFFPKMSVNRVTREHLKDKDGHLVYGNGKKSTFSGFLKNGSIVANTLKISDDYEIFTDQYIHELKGTYSGIGKINHFNGRWCVSFHKPPEKNMPIQADYLYYSASNTLQTFDSENINKNILALSDEYIYPIGFKHDLNQDNKINDQDAQWIVQWIRGYESPLTKKEKAWKLGAINHSKPSMLTPPSVPTWYTGSAVTQVERKSYDHFRKLNQNRSAVIFVGTKDGLLHAFDAGKFKWGDNPNTIHIHEKRGYFQWGAGDIPCNDPGTDCLPDYGSGKELWAFIPPNMLPKLKYTIQNGEDWVGMDASPILSNVCIKSTWKSILLMTEGNGGDFLFCLDVTDPIKPVFLWEYGSPDLFRKNASPAIPAVGRILNPQTEKEKWIVFVLSGDANKDFFPVVSLIDISSGHLYASIHLNDEIDLNDDGLLNMNETEYGRGGILASCPIIIDSDHNGYIDRIYVASSRGMVYKINIPDDPLHLNDGFTHCIINSDFSDSNKIELPQNHRWQPIQASPIVVFDHQDSDPNQSIRQIRIFFGTSHDAANGENISTGYFFSYIDKNPKGECDSNNHALDWYIKLEPGQGLFTPAFASAEQIYFGTSKSRLAHSLANPDHPAEGNIYAVTFDGKVKFRKHTEAIAASPIVEDQHLYIRTLDGLQSFGQGIYNNEIKRIGIPRIRTLLWRESSDPI